jgi:hypothetical protein
MWSGLSSPRQRSEIGRPEEYLGLIATKLYRLLSQSITPKYSIRAAEKPHSKVTAPFLFQHHPANHYNPANHYTGDEKEWWDSATEGTLRRNDPAAHSV